MAVGGFNWSGCHLECLEWNYDNTVIINLIVHLRRRLPKYHMVLTSQMGINYVGMKISLAVIIILRKLLLLLINTRNILKHHAL